MYPSQRFGRYEIVRKLGPSMTDVYLAVDTVEHRQAALKLIKAGRDASTQIIVQAERRGAAIQKRLHEVDARVAEIYDFGDQDGYFFVAMQYVEGRSLAETLDRDRRIEPRRAARIALELCGQLEKFHSLQAELDGPRTGVIHGDIKPSNVHLGPHDTVRLLDFGIAKALRANRDSTLHSLGTPGYCSPERLDASQVDTQSDLWSVGVTLYEMVAGAPPYQAENTQKLERLIRSRRPPRALPEDCPPALKAVILKAVAGDPRRRYRSAAEFREDLQALLEDRETRAERERRFAWQVNPTVEAAGVRRPLTAVPENRGLWLAGLVAFFTGLLVFVATVEAARFNQDARRIRAGLDYARRPVAAINADWVLYGKLQQRFGFLGRLSPAHRLREPLEEAYLRAGDGVVEQYRAGRDGNLHAYDWARAQLAFDRAAQLGAPARPKLALVNGYLALLEVMDHKAPDRVMELRQAARRAFEEAARGLPSSPDPHLALARVYVYSIPDGNRARVEFRAAERLGYALGPREMQQLADAYRTIRRPHRWRRR